VRGGENLLVNRFSAYILNPAKTYTSGHHPHVVAAGRFIDFLTSQSFRNAVRRLPSASDPAFHANRVPEGRRAHADDGDEPAIGGPISLR